MSAEAKHHSTLQNVLHSLEAATHLDSPEKVVQAVKFILESAIRETPGFLPERFTKTSPQNYARRLVYADPQGRFTVMAMVWDKEQGTPLHDHDGLWVVECVYAGRMFVTNYAYEGLKDGLHQFSEQYSEFGVPGEADYRIPPFEHHVLRNAQDAPSVTLHVFGGAMTRCQIFEPVEGGYKRSDRDLVLTA